jgi:hypothetical protein
LVITGGTWFLWQEWGRHGESPLLLVEREA